MNTISDMLTTLKNDWAEPKPAVHNGEASPFKHKCRFADGVRDGLQQLTTDLTLPSDLLDFWKEAKTAILFEDADYGQWGLEILSPLDVLSETAEYCADRPVDTQIGDIIIGRFLGDTDLVLIRCDESCDDYGAMHVVLSVDERADWPCVGKSFSAFLERFILESGAKYWE